MCFIDQLKELKLENEDLKVCLKQTKEHYEKVLSSLNQRRRWSFEIAYFNS